MFGARGHHAPLEHSPVIELVVSSYLWLIKPGGNGIF